jgi:hypothetical protein
MLSQSLCILHPSKTLGCADIIEFYQVEPSQPHNAVYAPPHSHCRSVGSRLREQSLFEHRRPHQTLHVRRYAARAMKVLAEAAKESCPGAATLEATHGQAESFTSKGRIISPVR